VYNLRTGVVDTSIRICKHTLCRACTCARVCTVCLLSLGNEGGGVELVYVGHLFAGVEGYFDMRKIGVLSVFSLFFDGGVGGKASGRDASGAGRREYYYRNSFEEDVSIITETASFFFTQSSNHRDLSHIDPLARVL